MDGRPYLRAGHRPGWVMERTLACLDLSHLGAPRAWSVALPGDNIIMQCDVNTAADVMHAEISGY